jgi:hypothetical protein
MCLVFIFYFYSFLEVLMYCRPFPIPISKISISMNIFKLFVWNSFPSVSIPAARSQLPCRMRCVALSGVGNCPPPPFLVRVSMPDGNFLFRFFSGVPPILQDFSYIFKHSLYFLFIYQLFQKRDVKCTEMPKGFLNSLCFVNDD